MRRKVAGMDGGKLYHIGGNDWRFRRQRGRLLVQGRPLHYFVDEADHTVVVADNGNAAVLFAATIEAMNQVVRLEFAEAMAFGGDIEPIGPFGGNVPLLPNDPSTDD